MKTLNIYIELILKKVVLIGFIANLITGTVVDVHAAPGDLDLSFGVDGKVTTDFGAAEYATGLAIQTDGKIIAVGTYSPYVVDFALAR